MNESPALPLDLFGHPLPRGRARPVLAEAAALHEVLAALRAHPQVCWAERLNTGAARVGRRFVRFGFPGCPDVLGQLHDGRLLAVEVKGPRGRLRTEQKVVLTRVAAAGGVAFVARSLRDVVAALGPLDRVVASPCADRGACTSVGLFAASRCGA
ncbi:MAG: VRR-NUC domain-containing protein [Betaproteobacteria bacterium]|jgi:hypothetical protein